MLVSTEGLPLETVLRDDSHRVTTLLVPPGAMGLSWYTSARNPTLNIESGSLGIVATAGSRFCFGGVDPLGALATFSFFTLAGLLRSGSFCVLFSEWPASPLSSGACFAASGAVACSLEAVAVSIECLQVRRN